MYCNSTIPVGEPRRDYTLEEKDQTKGKGAKYYQNTHGKVYRVKPNPKANKRKLLQKRQRKIDAQLKAAA